MQLSHLLPPLLGLLICFQNLIPSLSQTTTPTSSSPFSECAPLPYACGGANITISYPFRLDVRPDYCGHLGYYVSCTSDNSTLNILIGRKNNFQITSIDYVNSLLNIVDTANLQQSCPDQSYTSTSIDPALFQYSDRDRNITLYINCSTTASSSIPSGLTDIGCLTGQHSYYRLNNGTALDDLLGLTCSSTVEVPLQQEAAQDLVSGKLQLAQALQRGFSVRWVAGGDWCGGCVSSGGYCGYNSTRPEEHTCFCPQGTFVGSCDSDDGGKSEVRRKFIIGICVGLPSFLLGSFLFFLGFCSPKKISELFYQKKNSSHKRTIKAFLEKYNSLAMKRYTYSDIKKITKSFGEKLGQGGYGSVYKGKLFDGHLVAVKILSKIEGDGEDFLNEVAAIGSTSHVNVIGLRGFCIEGSKRALIYDYMANGSLEKYIYAEEIVKETSLGWAELYEIAIGIARGLEYLHRGCKTRIVHFDIKPHNILLDQDFCPKISDFGMAKLCQPKQSIISMYGARGTIGYIAPEVFSRTFGVVSSKSDVYSYGMLLLQMFGCKSKVNTRLESASEAYFPQSIYRHLENDNGDLDLGEYGVTNDSEEVARKMMIVGFWCIQTLPENRPTMSRVVEMLEGSINDLPIPPKPLLSSPSDLVERSYASSYS